MTAGMGWEPEVSPDFGLSSFSSPATPAETNGKAFLSFLSVLERDAWHLQPDAPGGITTWTFCDMDGLALASSACRDGSVGRSSLESLGPVHAPAAAGQCESGRFLSPLWLWSWFSRRLLHLRRSSFKGQDNAEREGQTNQGPPEKRRRSPPKTEVSCFCLTVPLRHIARKPGVGTS